MDHRVAVCLGPVLRIVVDVRHRIALMGHNICLQEGARLATMWRRLQENKQDDYKSCIIECYVK
jgi:hypothetical protein